MSSAKKTPKKRNDLEKHAETIRKDLDIPRQNDVFRAAVEAGYLAALSDGEVDDSERAAMVAAIEVLSTGAVIEWEVEALLDQCAAGVKETSAAKRAEAVGTALKELGQAEAGLLFAAFVAEASGGVDAGETEVLEAIARAAGVGKDKLTTLVKRAAGR